MNKPTIDEVLEILEMKEQAVELFAEIDKRVEKIRLEFGAQRFDYDLYEADEDGKRYLKFQIQDHLQDMMDGKDVWKSVPFKAVSFSTSKLKGCPKSLK